MYILKLLELNPDYYGFLEHLIAMYLDSLQFAPGNPEYLSEYLKSCSTIDDYLKNLPNKDALVKVKPLFDFVRAKLQDTIKDYDDYLRADVKESFVSWGMYY